MPVPISAGRSGGASEERVQKLERETARLRADLESIRGKLSGESGAHASNGWLTIAMSALALLLGLFAVLRH